MQGLSAFAVFGDDGEVRPVLGFDLFLAQVFFDQGFLNNLRVRLPVLAIKALLESRLAADLTQIVVSFFEALLDNLDASQAVLP